MSRYNFKCSNVYLRGGTDLYIFGGQEQVVQKKT